MNNSLVNLCVDARRGRVGNFSANGEKYTDEAARNAFAKVLDIDLAKGDKLTYSAWRKHKIEVFEVIEEVLKVTLPDAWDKSYFYNELVEIRNLNLGDKNEFIVEDPGTLIVSRFSGNHWNIDRQKLPAGKTFTVGTEWFGVRVYEEFERFFKGINTLAEMFNKIQDAFQKEIDARIYAAFNGAGTYLPAAFKENGTFDEKTFLQLCQKVAIASGKEVRIAGTKIALAKLGSALPAAWVSDEMKNEKNTTGMLKVWNGISTIEIPQSFIRGTFNVRTADNKLFVLPMNYKPIKLVYEGDVRTRELGMTDTIDQTVDVETQIKFGIGVIFESYFGVDEFTP